MKFLDFNGIGEILFDVRFPKGSLRKVSNANKLAGNIAPDQVWLTKQRGKYIICENSDDLNQAASDLNLSRKNLNLYSLTRRAIYHTELQRFEHELRDEDRFNGPFGLSSYPNQNLEQRFSWQKFGNVNQSTWPHPTIMMLCGLLLASTPILALSSYVLAGAALSLPLSVFGYQWHLNTQPKFTFSEDERQQFSHSARIQRKTEVPEKTSQRRRFTPLQEHHKQLSKQPRKRPSQPTLVKPGLFKKPIFN